MSCSATCKYVGKNTIEVYCCCPEEVPCIPPWVKKAFLAIALTVPVILAARWIITKGHLEYIRERMEFLTREKRALEGKIQSLVDECCPSQKDLSGSTARRKAALDQLRCWAWKSNRTCEKVVGLRKEKTELEHTLTQVCRERDTMKRDLEIVQSVIKRNCYDDCMDA
ncbi:uncharacterized protein [Halyomorpha halys]|uniref:uncharacterized protein n=1 Tax=Halyomorpha halys TaxID=286706 RepID=UPI0006D503FF|nr:uncharacterized protein LOC106678670 [Halyomorpha halys]